MRSASALGGGIVRERQRVLVTGAAGFIGSHLANYLIETHHEVRCVDIRQPAPATLPSSVEFYRSDLRGLDACLQAVGDTDVVYHLAADMGGIGYIEQNRAKISFNNTMIDAYMLEASRRNGVRRFLYTSSACVYPGSLQSGPEVPMLREDDAYPADSEDGYGWQKLMTERLCRLYREDYGLTTRIARLHNIFGPSGTWTGGREKSVAAICRKIGSVSDPGMVDVWGDGQQVRSYCYITDCVEGLYLLMHSDCPDPVNIGQDRAVTVDELVDIVAAIAEKRIEKKHLPAMPTGVRARNADITRARELVGWVPKTTLEDGVAATYNWILKQI